MYSDAEQSAQNLTTPTADISNQPIQPSEKPKNNKKTIILLSILLCLALLAAGVFAVLYFTSNTNNNAQEVTPNNQAEITTNTEETTITDSDIKRDLDQKIAIVLNTDDTSPTYIAKGIGQYDIKLFQNGNIDQSEKVRSLILNTLEMRPLSEQEAAAVTAQISNANSSVGIDADVVAQKYKEIFGEEFTKGPINSVCGEYEYNEQYDIYFIGLQGCGGTTPYVRYYYKNRYTTDGDHAYVYTSTAFTSPTFGNTPEGYNTESDPTHVYCDIADLGETGPSDGAKECATLQSSAEVSSFTLDSSNYEQYSEYRFVFNKGEDGKYHFETVESI